MVIAAMIAFAVLAIFLILIEPRRPSEKQVLTFCGRFYAHRGLHTQDRRIPENSLAAFRAAAEEGYGIELDVRMTKDGELVVFHDLDLERVCGISRMVENCTLSELREYPLFGTEERIPLFSEVLEAIAGRVPVIVELKTCEQMKAQCKKTAELLDGYEGDAAVQSFNPRHVRWFKQHKPNYFRGQLTSPYSELKTHTSKLYALAASHVLANFMTRPHFIAHRIGKKSFPVKACEWLGAKKFTWTVRSETERVKYEQESDGIIFEFIRPE